MGKFAFTYEKFVDLLKENEKNAGDINGDNGQNRDALLLCYYLIQKYDGRNLYKVIDAMSELNKKGIDYIAQTVVKDLWDY